MVVVVVVVGGGGGGGGAPFGAGGLKALSLNFTWHVTNGQKKQCVNSPMVWNVHVQLVVPGWCFTMLSADISANRALELLR